VAMVLVDRSMPGLCGEQIVERLRELDATLPVAMLTGQPGPGGPNPLTVTLAKPIDATRLLHEVRRAIDRRKPVQPGTADA